jgi:hypothetical protein
MVPGRLVLLPFESNISQGDGEEILGAVTKIHLPREYA